MAVFRDSNARAVGGKALVTCTERQYTEATIYTLGWAYNKGQSRFRLNVTR